MDCKQGTILMLLLLSTCYPCFQKPLNPYQDIFTDKACESPKFISLILEQANVSNNSSPSVNEAISKTKKVAKHLKAWVETKNLCYKCFSSLLEENLHFFSKRSLDLTLEDCGLGGNIYMASYRNCMQSIRAIINEGRGKYCEAEVQAEEVGVQKQQT